MSKNAINDIESATTPRIVASLVVGIMCLVNLLLNIYVFSLIPFVYNHWGLWTTIEGIIAFTLGLFVIGPLNSWFVETFPRKTVCLKGILFIFLPSVICLYITEPVGIICSLGMQGVCCEIAQNALCNTLINDLQVSRNRTRGDILLNKCGHLGLPIGWLWGIYQPLLTKTFALSPFMSLLMFTVPLFISFILVAFIHVPIKAPIHVRLFSSDRFFRFTAWPLFLITVGAAMIEGLYIGATLVWAPEILAENSLYLGAGFIISLLLQRIVFTNADTRAEFVGGIIFLLAALLLFLHPLYVMHSASFLIFGIGIGLLAARLLMYFLKLSGHCQRGTSQNTHFLGWRLGFVIGLIMGITIGNEKFVYIALFLVVLIFIVYLFFIHPWFEKNRDRDFNFKGY